MFSHQMEVSEWIELIRVVAGWLILISSPLRLAWAVSPLLSLL